MGEIIRLNEKYDKSRLSGMVREPLEKTLNELLDTETNEITLAHRHERIEDRFDTRAGHCYRKMGTKARVGGF